MAWTLDEFPHPHSLRTVINQLYFKNFLNDVHIHHHFILIYLIKRISFLMLLMNANFISFKSGLILKEIILLKVIDLFSVIYHFD
jgi:hypothetical protein